jgi:hypothetical protein
MRRGNGISSGLVLAGALCLLAAPARAVGPEGETVREPYEYPAGPAQADEYPTGWVRVPAAAADLVLVRPVMLAGLAAGAVLFVASLPFTAPTLTTDDAAHALLDQTRSALTRPLGAF